MTKRHPFADQLKLKRPCRHCPFSRHPQRIRFSCRERAEEIEELAYREGFPCHESAVLENEDSEEGGSYEFGPGSQHCVGAIFLRLNGGEDCWPALDNEPLPQSYLDRVEPFLTEGWADTEEFFAANEAEDDR